MQPNRTTRQGTARPRSWAIDGLVGISLIAIVCGQAGVPGLTSATCLLSVLLVVSGYLSTCAIVRAFEATRGEGLGITGVLRLLWLRLRHVWPSLVTVVAFVAAICAVLDASLLATVRSDALPALGYYANWWDLFRNATPGSTGAPLGNMWFIAVEMQLYVVWLLLLSPLMRAGKVWARRCAMIFSALSMLWLVMQCVTGGNTVRVSLGTDTRACSFFLGAWLAFVFPLGRVPVIGKDFLLRPIETTARRMRRRRYQATPSANIVGILSFVGIAILLVLMPTSAGGTLSSGILTIIISLLAVMLVATLLAPGSWLGRVFSLAPFTWLGSRALGIYLWSYPLFAIVAARHVVVPWYLHLVTAAATLVAAELTYRLVELAFASRETRINTTRNVAPYRLIATALAIVLAGGFAIRAMLTIPTEATAATITAASTTPSGKTNANASSVGSNNTSTNSTTSSNNSDGSNTAQSTTNSSVEAPTNNRISIDDDTIIHAPASETKNGRYDPVLIGDSVPGDADWSRLPDALIDSYIGRRPDQALEVARGYIDQDGVGNVVILACFSNVPPTADQLDQFAELFGDERQIYLVGTVNPDGFMDQANSELQSACARHSNMHYIDWPAVEEGHEKEYLWDDATHLRPEGGVVYVNMVVNAIAQDLIDAGGATE